MKRQVIVYFIVTFLLGALAGAGGGSLYRKYGRQGRRAPTRQDVVKHLKQELSLNDEQSGRVQQIIEEMRDKHGEVHKNSDQQHAAMREIAREQIREVVTDEQRERFEAMVEKFDKRRAQRARRRRR